MSCNDLIRGLNPLCDALNKVGGANKRIYIGVKSQITGYSQLGNGDINSISMDNNGSVPFTLYKFTSKRDKNSGSFPLTIGENVNTFNHTVVTSLHHSTSTDLDTLEKLSNEDDVFAILQGNDGKLLVFGIDLGLNASAGEGGTGTVLNDSTAYKLTLSGEQMKAPRYFNVNASATLAQNLAYLDSIAV